MKYIIIDSDRLEDLDFSEVSHHTKETVRRSLNGLKSVIKFYDKPSFVHDDTKVYNHEEMLEIVSGSEWTEEIDL